MMKQHRWWSPPRFPDETENRVAALVYSVLMASLGLVLVGLLTSIVTHPLDPASYALAGSVFVVGLLAYGLLNRGALRAAAWLVVWLVWTAVAVAAVLKGGLGSGAVALFPVVTMVAALAVGQRGIWLTAGASGVLLTGVAALGDTLLQPPIIVEGPLGQWLTSLMAVGAGAVFVQITFQHWRQANRIIRDRDQEIDVAVGILQQTSVSQAFMDDILNSMLDMLLVLDANLNIVMVNPSTCKQLGCTQAQLVGRPFADLLADPTDVVLTRIRQLQNAAPGDSAFHTTTRYRTKPGGRLHVEFTASRMQAPGAARQIVCVAHDVTDRVQANEALRMSENRLRTAIENVDTVLLSLDASGTMTYFEGRGLNAIGMQPGQFIGQNLFDLTPHLPHIGANAKRALRGERFNSVVEFNGFVFDAYHNPIVGADGQTTGAIIFALNVTDFVTTERSLAEERNLLRTLIDTLPDYIHLKDPNGRYLLSNAAHTRLSRVERQQDIIGRTAADIFGVRAARPQPDNDAMVLATRSPVAHVEQWKLGDNDEPVWVQTMKVPLFKTDGDLLGILEVSTDITQRKRDEERIRESEERLRALVTNAPVFIFAIDHEYNITFFEGKGVSDANIEKVGALLGRSLFLPADDTMELRVARSVALAFNGKSVQTTMTVESLTFDIRYSPIVGPAGVVTGVTGVATDISEQRQAEEALRRSEARNRALLAALPDMMFVVNKDGVFTDYKAHSLDELVTEPAAIIGSTIYDVGYDDGKVKEVEQAIHECLVTGDEQRVEYTLNTVGKRCQVYEARYARMNDDEVLSVIRNVTVARQVARDLQQFTEELARSNKELEEFAYIASHDLQEPLRKIQAFGGRLQANGTPQLDPTAQDYLERMMGAANRMQVLIQDLLAFSRVTTQAQPFQAVNLNAVIAGVLEDLEYRIEQTGAGVTVAQVPIIEAEDHQMRQLFQNLIGNALKYTRPGVTPRVDVRYEQHNRLGTLYAHIAVQDNGIGFEGKHAERIFSPFQRLHNRREYPGTGMGLALCRKIVERHRGKIYAEGTPGAGAVFYVELPVKQATGEAPFYDR
jgi:PAS domain S-box-containing protein